MRGQGLTIEVEVKTLLKTLVTNREQHLKDHKKAKEGWRKLLLKDLGVLHADLIANKSIEATRLHLKSKPQHYLNEYDEAIEILNYAANPIIELDQQQFRAYVKDEWTWKTQWEASNSTYHLAAGG